MDKTIVDMLKQEIDISDEDLNELTPEAKRIPKLFRKPFSATGRIMFWRKPEWL